MKFKDNPLVANAAAEGAADIPEHSVVRSVGWVFGQRVESSVETF